MYKSVPTTINETGMNYNAVKCFQCGKEGHIKKECPANNKFNKKSKIKCFNCGKHGHIARECPAVVSSGNSEASSDIDSARLGSTASSNPVAVPSSVNFIDSHCHIDYVLERYRYPAECFQKFQSDFSFPETFAGCVTTFCDPSAFSSFGIFEELLNDDRIWGTFGFHPHNAKYYNEEIEGKLLQCLAHPKTVALGEIGLDYSVRSQSDPEIQKQVFSRQVKLAMALGKPLVIHCREAEDDVFRILSSSLPETWKIHLHCYTGDYDMAKKFMDHFPNLYIGISGVITFSKAMQVRNVVYDLPIERLVLETDAPYLIPAGASKKMKWNHPGLIPLIAEEVAKVKLIEVDTVLEHALQNTRNLYAL